MLGENMLGNLLVTRFIEVKWYKKQSSQYRIVETAGAERATTPTTQTTPFPLTFRHVSMLLFLFHKGR